MPKATKVQSVPPYNKRLVVTREAAKLLGLTMGSVRALARRGVLDSWTLGPATRVFTYDDVMEYRKTSDEGRRKGVVRGAKPGGFKPDATIPKKKRKVS
jgi:excisionase family DNA binding protein